MWVHYFRPPYEPNTNSSSHSDPNWYKNSCGEKATRDLCLPLLFKVQTTPAETFLSDVGKLLSLFWLV